MLYLEVRLLNLEEMKQKDNAREPPGFHVGPGVVEMAPHSHAISLWAVGNLGSAVEIFRIYIHTLHSHQPKISK